jgi:hypothetical protein
MPTLCEGFKALLFGIAGISSYICSHWAGVLTIVGSLLVLAFKNKASGERSHSSPHF